MTSDERGLGAMGVVIAATAALVSATSVRLDLLSVAIRPFVVVSLTPAVAAVSGFLFGPVAVGGVVLGTLVGLAYHGPSEVLLVDSVGAVLICGWVSLAALSLQQRGGFRDASLGHVLRAYAAAGVPAVLLSTAVVTYGYTLSGAGRYYPHSVVGGVNLALSVFVVGGFLLIVTSPVRRVSSVVGLLRRATRPFVGWSAAVAWRDARLSALLALWLLVGSGISVFFDVVDLIPAFVFSQRGLEPLLVVKEVSTVTESGALVQAVLGALVLSFWVVYLRRLSAARATRS